MNIGRTKEPTWNEEFALNIKLPPNNILQVILTITYLWWTELTNTVLSDHDGNAECLTGDMVSLSYILGRVDRMNQLAIETN